MLSNTSWISRLTVVLFLVSIYLINWEPDRTEFVLLITSYTLAFGSYLLLLRRNDISFGQLAIVSISAHVIAMLFEPNLSVDYYRFLWDGEMAWLEINPFDFKPNEVINQPFLKDNSYMHELYAGLSDLSRRNYTCYPTINQTYFVIATAFSDSIVINTVVLKLLIVITEIFGGIYLFKLLRFLNMPVKKLWILFLNPLWIIESTGNTHFEGVMVSFLIIALYFIVRKKLIIGAIWFAVAIQIKLVPLLLLPFFFRFLGFWKSALLYTVTLILVFGVGLIHIDGINVYNFLQSLTLYFKVFEFNSFVFYNGLQIVKSFYDWNPIRIYGPILSRLAMAIIVAMSLIGKSWNREKMFNRMALAFFVYLLLNSTVHPWYTLPLLALSLFTNYTFPVIWTFLAFFSYFLYSIGSGSAWEVRTLVNIEYVIVLGIFIYELKQKKSLFALITPQK